RDRRAARRQSRARARGPPGGHRRALHVPPGTDRVGRRGHRRGDDAAVPLRLRRYCIHARRAFHAPRKRPHAEPVLGSYPKYSILKGQVPLVTQRIPALLMDLRERYSDGRVNVLDGLRVDWPGRWFHVRVSQTEPIVRVICEQQGDPPKELFEALLEEVRSFA